MVAIDTDKFDELTETVSLKALLKLYGYTDKELDLFKSVDTQRVKCGVLDKKLKITRYVKKRCFKN